MQKYGPLTNHMWDGWWFLINGRVWRRMPPDLQEVFARVINGAAMAQRAEMEQQNGALKDALAQKGLIFNEVDPAPFQAKLVSSGFYKTWKDKFGADSWALLEESAGPLS